MHLSIHIEYARPPIYETMIENSRIPRYVQEPYGRMELKAASSSRLVTLGRSITMNR